jgi:hypothetical protein
MGVDDVGSESRTDAIAFQVATSRLIKQPGCVMALRLL